MLFQQPLTEETVFPLAGFAPSQGDPELPGVNLLYVVDKPTAGTGEHLTFTAWILNSSAEVLTDINLHLRSFTNSLLEPVHYKTQPSIRAMNHRFLAPHRSISFTFTYVVGEGDVVYDGLLISALQVSLLSPSRGRLHSECDAMVTMDLAP
ncbi:hypothetical protein MB46_19470 (plasmid) [Arthrobacter alpinus]|uniref:hypothetical protein n=1 Tax=Arthrobacter alpinus TaxID=656366 RepID=UPI000679103E|nr:hypothetical protein [Arthrobacter alpinus]ALV47855.1 hypothetical protein MB46_19470 [Arthrobacter alpinus]